MIDYKYFRRIFLIFSGKITGRTRKNGPFAGGDIRLITISARKD